MVILYLSQQTNTRSKSTKDTLEITEDSPNENIFKKQQPLEFYKKWTGFYMITAPVMKELRREYTVKYSFQSIS